MHIYLSYAEEDATSGNRFKDRLKPVANNLGFTTWSKQEVTPGQLWQQEMALHLKEALLFVPMISADYLVSDRCQAETTAALRLEQEGHLKIVCVFLRPTYLEFSPLEHTRFLPARDQPISRWRNQDEAWLQVQHGILDVIKRSQIG